MADPIKQEVIIDINLEQDEGAFKKLADLKGTLNDLKNQRNGLNEALKKELITQREYNSEIVRVEALQKRAAAQYNQTQRSVTGLKNPFDKLNDSIKNQTKLLGGALPALDKISGGSASAATGIFSMVKAAAAFIATPLGLALAAITALLAPFATFLFKTGEGADLVNREMEGFRSVLDKVKAKLIETGKEQKGFFDNLIEGIKDSNPVLRGLITAYEGLAEEGKNYADVLDRIQDGQENFSIQAAKDENEVKRLILQSKNRTSSEKERVDLLERALSIEAALVAKRTQFAQDEFSAIVERNRSLLETAHITQQAGETQEEFIDNNINAIRDFDEALATSLINSRVKLEEAKASGIAIEEKAQNQLDAIKDKADKKEDDRKAKKFKDSEDERKQRIEDLDAKMSQEENELISDQERADFNAELDQKVKAGLTERLNAYEDGKKKRLLQALEFERGVTQARIGLAGQLGVVLTQLAGRNKILATAGVVIERAAAIASILAHIGEANAKAIASSPLTLGQPWVGINTASGLLSITSILASAAQSISAINSSKFAHGGIANNGGVLNGRSHANGGIPFSVGGRVGFEAEGGEAIINKRSTSLFRRELSAINQAGGGVPFASGGITGNETRIATANATAKLDFNQLLNGINRIQTVLVLPDLRDVENSVDTINRRATVVG